MLIKLAWRNIWRNKRRSLVVLLSVIVGVNAILFMDGLSNGFLSQILFNQISTNVSHIQIHKNGFKDNKVIQSHIPDNKKVENTLQNTPGIKYYSKRVISFGLLSSASNSSGVYLNGIDSNLEADVSLIDDSIVEGTYLSSNRREIIVGKKLAEKLKVGVGDKVVALSNTPDGTIGSDVFRIVGLFSTTSSEINKTYIFVNLADAQNMLEIGDKLYEFAIIAENQNAANIIRDKIRDELDEEYEVLSYLDLLPFVILQLDMYKESMFIVNFIIGLALIFGIINSMLMSVFERINEIGVLMSIGMKNIKIFNMILLEALIIGVMGTTIGMATGYLLHLPLGHYGIDLSNFAASLESFGIGAVIYPMLSIDNFIITVIMIPFISVAGAVYPAYKAIKLEPVNAVRYV